MLTLTRKLAPQSLWLRLMAVALFALPALTRATIPGWTSQDIGAVGAAGSDSLSGGVYEVIGAGEDIWDTADEFHYVYQPWTGDGVFVVRVTSTSSFTGWAKAGLMLRNDLSPGSAHVLACINGLNQHAKISRSTAGGTSAVARPSGPDNWESLPTWLKLTRSGNTVSTYFSNDGVTWRWLSTDTVAMGSTAYIGLAVTSHLDRSLATVRFDNLSLSASSPTELTGIARLTPDHVDLRWVDNSDTETGFQIERSTDNVSFALIGSVAANTVSYSDTTVARSTVYYYRVRSTADAGSSIYSNTASVTTPPPAPAGWQNTDVGNTELSGRATESGGTFTVAGSGAGVGGVDNIRASQYKGDFGYHVVGYSDEFQYLYKSWSGDGEMIARINALTGPAGAQAGVMVRNSLDASSQNVFIYVNANGGRAVTVRQLDPVRYTSGYYYSVYNSETFPATSTASGVVPPTWIKLVRESDGVMTYISTDGVNWQDYSWTTVTFPADQLIGLAVSSHQDGVTATATFDHVAVQSVTTPTAPPPAPTDLHVTSFDNTDINLAWTNQGAFGSVRIERSSDGVNFTALSQPTFAGNQWSDYWLDAGATYTYRVREERGSRVSPWVTITASTKPYPAAPSNFTATAVSASQITLSWTDNATNEDSYSIAYSTNGTNWTWNYVPANTTSFGITGLSAGTTYYFQLYVFPSQSGFNQAYQSATATTFDSGPPLQGPSNLDTTAVTSTYVDLTWIDNSSDETGFQMQRATDTTGFTVIWTGGPNENHMRDATVSPGTTYYYRVRALRGSTTSNYSATLVVRTNDATPTSSWRSGDVGAPGANGSDTVSGSTATVTGAGEDIWGTADEFHFAYQQWNGDGEFVARLTGMTNTHAWAKAGIMFRETLDAGSRYAMAYATPNNYGALQMRTATNGNSDFVVGPLQVSPMWVKLTRTGNVFAAYQSADGTNWTFIASTTVNAAAAGYVGLAVTSHVDGTLCTATFDNVRMGSSAPPPPPPPPPPAPIAPTNLSASATSGSTISLSWTDNSNNETQFAIERSTDGVSFAPIAYVGANTTTYGDFALTASTLYYYRVRANNGSTSSAYTNTASATTSGSSPPPSWFHDDIGSVGTHGDYDLASDGTISVRGSGADIWDTADGFQFFYRAWSGDGTILLRVDSVQNTHPWAKAGVMFRDNLAANSANAFVYLTPTNGVGFQTRATGGGTTSFTAGPWWVAPPYWVKLVRSGGTVSAYSSSDGVAWDLIGSQSVALGSSIYVGLAVTAHNNAALNTSTFSGLDVH
jgi:regulation of enolase protein 1 (concanavalin A-like superfamily)